MKLYKTSYTTNDGHQGYTYHGNKKEVEMWRQNLEQYLRLEGDEYALDSVIIEQITVQANKKGILDALNYHGGHNDNG